MYPSGKYIVSIVVPVFNDEKRIGRCIESVIKQSYTNIDLILVDDGSQDRTGKICDEYAAKDQRIKVVHTDNVGVGRARNLGIKHTCGTFIFFLDSDDFLEVHALGRMIDGYHKSNADIVLGNFYINGEKVKTCFNRPLSNDKLLNLSEFISYVRGYLQKPRGTSIFVYVWGKLFKSSIIKDNNLCFDSDLHVYEDTLFNFKYFLWIQNAYFIEQPLYHYQVDMNSKSKALRLTNEFLGYKKMIYSIEKFLTKHNVKKVTLEKEVGHCIVSFSIKVMMQLVEHSMHKELHISFAVLKSIFTKMVQDADIQKSLVHYSPTEKDSVIIPKLMKLQWILPIIWVCKFKQKNKD